MIAQKKRPGALNATQKTPALYKLRFLTNLGITSKNAHLLRLRQRKVPVDKAKWTVMVVFDKLSMTKISCHESKLHFRATMSLVILFTLM